MFKNKIILVTGGTGSFGNSVIRRFLGYGVKEVRVFSRDEKKQDDLRKKYNNKKLKFYIGDVRDYRSVLNSARGCHFIFHAYLYLLQLKGQFDYKPNQKSFFQSYKLMILFLVNLLQLDFLEKHHKREEYIQIF